MNSASPGGHLIDEGVTDLREGRETIAALVVAIGSPRLRLTRWRKTIDCTRCWRRMSLIPRIRATML